MNISSFILLDVPKLMNTDCIQSYALLITIYNFGNAIKWLNVNSKFNEFSLIQWIWDHIQNEQTNE